PQNVPALNFGASPCAIVVPWFAFQSSIGVGSPRPLAAMTDPFQIAEPLGAFNETARIACHECSVSGRLPRAAPAPPFGIRWPPSGCPFGARGCLLGSQLSSSNDSANNSARRHALRSSASLRCNARSFSAASVEIPAAHPKPHDHAALRLPTLAARGALRHAST